MRHKKTSLQLHGDHLAERTAFHVQLQAVFLSFKVLQLECIVQVIRAWWTTWLTTQHFTTDRNVLPQVETMIELMGFLLVSTLQQR